MFDDVICLSHLRWGFVYQRPNHLMSRCARTRRVFFVEEPVLDAVAPRLDVAHVQDGLHLVVPHLEGGTSEGARDAALRELLEELVARRDVREPVLWFYTPMALPYAPRTRAFATVYDCMDELSLFRGAPSALPARELELLRKADIVFTGGRSLYEAKRAQHPCVHAFPSSVEVAHFECEREAVSEPEDQRSIPRPRIGYFGVVDERMDLDLVRAVAEGRPDLQFVMIGPLAKIDPGTLPRGGNLHWLGPKAYGELPAYVAGWDAAIMPFARNDATRFISPTKTLEYLAAGKPVVSTSVADVVQPYGASGLVRIADDPHAFTAALVAALAERGTPARLRWDRARAVLLRSTSWDVTWATMCALVDRHGASATSRRAGARGGVSCSTT